MQPFSMLQFAPLRSRLCFTVGMNMPHRQHHISSPQFRKKCARISDVAVGVVFMTHKATIAAEESHWDSSVHGAQEPPVRAAEMALL